MQKTPLNLTLFLIVGSVLAIVMLACSTPPVAEDLNLNWSIPTPAPGEPTKACLDEEDVAKLREALVRCKEEKK